VVTVIPAAGLGERLMPISSALPKAMVPIGGQPLISLTLNHLIQQGMRDFVVVIGKHGDQVREYLDRTYPQESGITLTYTEQTELNGPLGALRLALQAIEGDRPILVWLGDTLSRDRIQFDRDFILVQPVDDHWRWCLARTNEAGDLTSLVDKPTAPTDANLALVGVYYFADGALLRACTEAVFRANETLAGEFQLSSAIERYNQHRRIAVRLADEWYDCGSIDRYIDTRRALIRSRSFNRIQVDDAGVLRKEALNNGDELRNEIGWYEAIPDAVRPLTPRVFHASREPGDTYLELEYTPVPTLAEVYLFANVHREVWRYALPQILGLWRDRLLHTSYPADDMASRVTLMYWEKTEQRLAQAAARLPDPGRAVTVNGRRLPAWTDLAPLVRERVRRLAKSPSWSLIHGDFHFGNIMFDFHSGQLKMIDPRGAFGRPGPDGDARYDLAKFLHSFHGGYAHLAADMFRLDRPRVDVYTLYLLGGADRDLLTGVVRDWAEQAGFDFDDLVFIEGLAFLALTALHEEHPDRQIAAYLIGLGLLEDVLQGQRSEAMREPLG